jgi:hypothetical protein
MLKPATIPIAITLPTTEYSIAPATFEKNKNKNFIQF